MTSDSAVATNVEANIALIRRVIAAMSEGDCDTLHGLVHPEDFEFTIPFVPDGFPPSVSGRDAWIQFVRDWNDQLDGGEHLENLRVGAMSSDPNEIVTFYTSDMLLKTGHRYRNSYVGRFEVRDGYITRFDEYLDSVKLLIAGGGAVTPPPHQVL